MKLRTSVTTFLLIAMLMIGFTSSAQELDPCLGLSADDCAVLNAASVNTTLSAESFQMDYSIDFSVTGTPDTIVFTHSGSGPVILDLTQDFPLTLGLVTNNSFDIAGEADSGPVELRVVGGFLYILVDGSWIGVNLIEAIESGALEESLPIPLPSDAGDIEDLAAGLDMSFIESLGELATVPGFLSQTRDGQTFTFVADLSAAFSSPAFTEALTGIGEAAGDPSIAMFGSVLPMIFTEATITVNQIVNAELNVIEGLDFIVVASIDPAMAGMMLDPQGSQATAPTDPINVNLNFSVRLSDVNGSFSVDAPAEFELIPLDGAMSGM